MQAPMLAALTVFSSWRDSCTRLFFNISISAQVSSTVTRWQRLWKGSWKTPLWKRKLVLHLWKFGRILCEVTWLWVDLGWQSLRSGDAHTSLCSPTHRVFRLFRRLVSFNFQIDFQEYLPGSPRYFLYLVMFPFTSHLSPIACSPSSFLGAFRIRHLSELSCDFAGFSFLVSAFSVTGSLFTVSLHLLW